MLSEAVINADDKYPKENMPKDPMTRQIGIFNYSAKQLSLFLVVSRVKHLLDLHMHITLTTASHVAILP